MEYSLADLIAQYGVMGSLLFAVMYWLVKHYLPSLETLHREHLDRIMLNHDQNTARLLAVVERNTAVVQYNSQALLVQSLVRGGLDRDEAELIAESIRFTTVATTPPDHHSAA